MDFTLSDEHQTIQRLATDLLGSTVTTAGVRAAEAGRDGFDRTLWQELAASGLLGAALPAQLGGEGLGLTSLCLLLEQQGRRTVPAPIWPTVVAALAIAEFGGDDLYAGLVESVGTGQRLLTAALEGDAQNDVRAEHAPSGWTLSGRKLAVPAADSAHAVVLTCATADGGTGLFLVNLPDPTVRFTPVRTTARERCATLDFENSPAVLLGEPDGVAADWIRVRAQLAVSALQLGVCGGAVERAVPYLNEREQFGRPLASFQAVAHQLADCYIDVEAMRATLWHAVWQVDNDLPPSTAAAVAKWWAGDAGQRVVHRITHVHGGMGVDTEYPIHRYLLWGKQLACTLGGASSELAHIGDRLAAAANA